MGAPFFLSHPSAAAVPAWTTRRDLTQPPARAWLCPPHRHTLYSGGYSETSPQVVWFWRVVQRLGQEERGLLLRFATGSTAPGPGGFARLRGLWGQRNFEIVRLLMPNLPSPRSLLCESVFFSNTSVVFFTQMRLQQSDNLPSASTCFNTLKLPAYSSAEV